MRSHFLPKEDIQKLKHCLSDEEWLPLQCSLETGLRIDDVLTRKGKDLGRERNGKKRYFLRFIAQKTGKKGKAYISENLYYRLRYHCMNDNEYIFKSYGKSGHLTRQAAWARMKRAANKAGVTEYGCSPHALRKSFAVALRQAEGLEAVRKALQHSNTAVTTIYAFADTVMNASPDEPIRWAQLEFIVDYILERIAEK